MTDKEKQKLNEKLARWAGFKETKIPSINFYLGCRILLNPEKHLTNEPDFTSSLDACLKWLVPKLTKELHSGQLLIYPSKTHSYCFEIDGLSYPDSNSPSLAICLAIEKLIDLERWRMQYCRGVGMNREDLLLTPEEIKAIPMPELNRVDLDDQGWNIKLSRVLCQAQLSKVLRELTALSAFTVKLRGNEVIVDKHDWERLMNLIHSKP